MLRVGRTFHTLAFLVLPFLVAAVPMFVPGSRTGQLIALGSLPLTYSVMYLVTCGLMSLPHRFAVREGQYRRSAGDSLYRRRELYEQCWNAVYRSPFYRLVMASRWPRWIALRLFGYRGSTNFRAHASVSIHNLPLVTIGSRASLGEGAILGKSVELANGRMLAGRTYIGSECVIGPRSLIAAGVQIGSWSEVHEDTACGARVRIGHSAAIQGSCILSHMSEIGEGTRIGAYSYVGMGAIVGPNLNLPMGTNIPRRAKITTQSDVERYASSDARELTLLRRELSRRMDRGLTGDV